MWSKQRCGALYRLVRTQRQSLPSTSKPTFRKYSSSGSHDDKKAEDKKAGDKMGMAYRFATIASFIGVVFQFYQLNSKVEEKVHNEHQRIENLEKEIETKLNTVFQSTTPMIPGLKLLPKAGTEVLPVLCSNNCIPQLCFIGGPSNSGKSMTIEKNLEGRKNVLYIPLRGNELKECLQFSLGIQQRRSDEKELTLPQIMLALRNVLAKIKKSETYGSKDNPVPIIVVSDFIADNVDCNVLAGNLLQFVEEQLANGIHVSSNQNTFSELRKLSGHTSRLKRYNFFYTSQADLEEYPFFRSEHVKKIGGYFGQIFGVLKDIVPKLELESSIMGKPRQTNEVIEQIVSGKIDTPDFIVKEVVDTLIQTEADELVKILAHLKKEDQAVVAVKLLNDLKNSSKISPQDIREMIVCDILVDRNILIHTFEDTSSFTWHRPILKYSFESRMDRIQNLWNSNTKPNIKQQDSSDQ